ncbi:MAG TPA: hypothetical protein VI112_11280 [Bacteroidia bacterium]
MNIRKALLAEHSKRQTLRIVSYIGSDSKRFAKLMEAFFSNEYRVTQRAAWVLTWTAKNDLQLFKPWIGKMIRNLRAEGIHDSVKRNTLRVLCDIQIPERLQGDIAHACFDLLHACNEPIAVKVFAMTILTNLCKQHPGMSPEVRLEIEDRMRSGSAAIRSRGKKLLARLENT